MMMEASTLDAAVESTIDGLQEMGAVGEAASEDLAHAMIVEVLACALCNE